MKLRNHFSSNEMYKGFRLLGSGIRKNNFQLHRESSMSFQGFSVALMRAATIDRVAQRRRAENKRFECKKRLKQYVF